MRTHRGPRRLGRTGRPSALLAGLLTAALGATLVVASPLAALADDSTATSTVTDPYADPEGRGPDDTTYAEPEAPAATDVRGLAGGDQEIGTGYSVADIGEGRRSNASGIAEDGTVSGTFFVGNETLPIVWKAGAVTQLDAPASTSGRRLVRAMSVGDDGTVAGWQFDDVDRKRYAVAWHRKADGTYLGMQRLSEVSFGEEDWQYGGEGKAVADDGSVLVTEPLDGVPWGSSMIVHPFGGHTELPPVPWSTGFKGSGTANDMNNDQLAVGTITQDQWQYAASSWLGGSSMYLPPVPNAWQPPESQALAVNDEGHVVVQSATTDAGSTVQLYRDGSWTDLGNVGAAGPVSNLEVWDINNKDAVVGAAHLNIDGVGTRHAFIWRDGKAIDLNNYLPTASGWELTAAHSINDRGQIVGIGWHRGVESGFVLDPTRPLLFVPGAGASILKSFDDPANPEEIWLGCGTSRLKLSLFDEDNPPQDVRAVDATRYMSCLGISGRKVSDLDAYGTFLEKLHTQYGYREYQVDEKVERRTTEGCDTSQRDQAPNLFVFAYDWRKDNRLAARQLEDYVGCIRQFFPDTDIDVVTHSMGSIVMRRYVMNNPGNTHLHKVVTIGAPWLGAPKLVNVLNTGDFVPWVADGDDVKHVAAAFRATHELMAGPYYHQMAGSVMEEDGWDYDGDGDAYESYDWEGMKAALDARITTAPAQYAEAFQTEGGEDGQADWSNDSSGLDYTHIYGIQTGENTIGKVVAKEDVFCTPVVDVVCVTRDYITQKMTQGDGTVPVTSANRIAADDDLNPPGVHLFPVVVPKGGNNDLAEHTAMTRNPVVIKKIIDTFRADDKAAPTLAPQDLTTRELAGSANPSPYRYVTLHGVQDVVVHDGKGGSTAPIDGDPGTRFPLHGVSHYTQGADGQLVTMPADVDHDWTITFTGTGEPMSLEAIEGTQEKPDAAVRYRDLVVPAGHDAELLLTPTGLERLRVDTDGDGSLDSTVAPTVDLVGDSALDVTAPEVAVSATTVSGAKRYVVSATDGDDGTGVRRVLWSTDGEHFTAYTSPVDAGSATTLHALAEDWAGNRSALVSLDLASAVEGPVTTATIDPAPSAQGWSAGPVTVTLTAQRGDAAPVGLIRYRTSGAQRSDETAVDGSVATVPVGEPGRTTVWYRAEGTDGSAEPWRQLVVRIDAAAPAARVQAPAAGSVVSSLQQVSGTAADDAAGVRSVDVTLERTTDGTFWDGTHWVADRTWLRARGTASWRLTGLPGIDSFTPGGYAVRARATDSADRVTVTPARTFVMAYAAPWKATALLPPSGVTAFTSALDIDDSGRVAGIIGTVSAQAAEWTAPEATVRPVPEGMEDGRVSAVLDDGSAVGYATGAGYKDAAFRWDTDGTRHQLPDLDSVHGSVPNGLSAAGVVGASGNTAVWWPGDDRVVALPTLHDGESAAATDIDGSGTIVGWVMSAAGVPQAVVWTDEGRRVTPLGSLGGSGSQALAINEVGQATGWSRNSLGQTKVFVVDVRDGEGMVEAYVPSFSAQGHDIADDGTVVGEYTIGDGSQKAFMVKGDTFTRLDNVLPAGTGWNLVRANGINNYGQITGFGIQNGLGRGFVMSAQHVPAAADAEVTTDAGTPVEVTVTASDPDLGDPLTYAVVDQPGHGSLSALAGRTTTYTPADGFTGTDSFTFRATDGGGLRSNTATVTVSVRPGAKPNQAPVAAIAAPATAPEGSTVTLDGSGSADADGTVASYAWDLDADGEYDDATGPTATLDVHQEGTRTVGLQVVDDAKAESTAVASVQVVNVVPVVSLPDPSVVQAGQPWSAAGSFGDPGDDSWSATVDLGDSSGAQPLTLSGKAFTASGVFLTPGERTVTVEVCDGTGCGRASTQVTVTPPPNRAPTAAISAPSSVPEGSLLTVDGSGSSDPDGTVASYAWDLDGDGQYDDATGVTPSVVVKVDGPRSVGLRVMDDDGEPATASTSVLVTNVAPGVTVPATSTVEAGKPWSVGGSFTDPGDDSWTATLDLGDGLAAKPLPLTGQAFTVAASFAEPGTRSVTVQVCDGTDCGSATIRLTVTAPTVPPASWPWDGFFQPVDNLPVVNTVKAGQAIPLKFSVGGYRGTDIFAAGYPASVPHSCSSSLPTDALEETVNPGASELTYDSGTDRYQYVWKTQKAYAGQCRTLVVKLADGTTHTAEFRFR